MNNKSVKKKSDITAFELVFSVIMTVVFLLSFCLIIKHAVLSEAAPAIGLCIYTLVLLFSLILSFGCMFGHNEDPHSKRLFELMIVLSFFSAFFGLAVIVFNGKPEMHYGIVISQILNNSLLAVYWLMFWQYQKNSYARYESEIIVDWIINVYMLIYIVYSCLNLFIPVLFAIDEDGYILYRSDSFLITYLSLWYVLYIVYVFTRKCELKVKFTLSGYVVFPLLLNIFSIFLKGNATFNKLYYPLNSLCFLIPLYLIYFNLHIESSKQLLIQKQELTAARINLMVSQIQPHFIYNSLTAIIDLIDKDAEVAKERIVDFSDYLRVNLDSLKEIKLIPFEKEMEHCKTYLTFEQLRFENIKVKYDMEITDFKLPVLTVQPLVENAIKHGLSKKEEGGTLTVSTRDNAANIIIEVKDDGVGFDDGDITDRVHVGLDNVEKRVSSMCGGSLQLISEKGKGTTVSIILPKEEIR